MNKKEEKKEGSQEDVATDKEEPLAEAEDTLATLEIYPTASPDDAEFGFRAECDWPSGKQSN